MQNEYISLLVGMVIDVKEYIEKAITFVKPAWAILVSAILFVMFPDNSFIPAAYGLGMLALLDIVVKIRAVGYKYGGFMSAFRSGHISSSALWKGTYRKLVTYLIIMILAGISMRITMAMKMSNLLATVAYVIMALRECVSILEGIRDSGDKWVTPIIEFLKKQQKEIIENVGNDKK